MEISPMLGAALLCALVGACCVLLSIVVAIKDRKARKVAAAKRMIVEKQAQDFMIQARVAEQKRYEDGARRKNSLEKNNAKSVLGLKADTECSRDEIMSAWRVIIKASHPDITNKEGRAAIERATQARDLLIKDY